MADSANSTSASRRAFLTSAPVAAFLAGHVSLPDPIFAAIAEHRRLVDHANEKGATEDECDLRSTAERTFFWESLLDVEPMTLVGVCALLVYVADDAEPFKCGDDPTYVASRVARAALAKLNITI